MSRVAGPNARGRGRLTAGRWSFWIALLFAAVVAIAIASLFIGVQPVRISEILVAGSLDHTIVLGIRLPRVVLGLMVGGALGGAGAALQAILRNPLADPFVLGVSGGAALGATLAIVAVAVFGGAFAEQYLPGGGAAAGSSVASGAAGWLLALPISLCAAFGALGTTLLMLGVARGGGRLDPHALLLAGVVFNAFAAALILFLRTMVTPDQAHALLPWLVGNLGHRPWGHLLVVATLILIGALFVIARGARLNLLSVGEESAATLGIDVDRTRMELVIVVSLMVGASVSLAGLVGFVGLVVPHLLRLMLGPDHRLLLPASFLGGGAFLVGCDLISRVAFLSIGTEPPVGVVTALIGAPVFLVLLRRSAAGGRE